ncbi:MAG TPA: DUF4147 domain-containing protein [Thermoanaerobaculia bacterium]|nr:DUF4147 domain-containing protein [Thermoanaerobaculia bacterium]
MKSELLDVYRAALAACDPARLMQERFDPDLRERLSDAFVIVLGKAAARITDALLAFGWKGRGFIGVPSGYGTASWPSASLVAEGSHPSISKKSFEAGSRLLETVSRLDEPAFVFISGGASACVESPLSPWIDRDLLSSTNEKLLRGGISIEEINVVRKHLSAIKGGRLAGMLRPESTAWILSDVPSGRLDLVGSGPTLADPSTSREAAAILERVGGERSVADQLRSGVIPESPKEVAMRSQLLGDNRTLVRAAVTEAGSRGYELSEGDRPLDVDVETAAKYLAERLRSMTPGTIFIGGGEPTVVVSGDGTGGRCSELAVRLLLRANQDALPPFDALIASSDGVDGNSGAAGYLFRWNGKLPWKRSDAEAALTRSDAHGLMARGGEPIIMQATGNNLRDLMMMARR